MSDTTTTTGAQAGKARLNSYQVTVYVRQWNLPRETWGIFYAENRVEAERKARDYYCYVDEKIEVLLVAGVEPSVSPDRKCLCGGPLTADGGCQNERWFLEEHANGY